MNSRLNSKHPMPRRLFLIGASAMVLSACGGNLLGPPDAGPLYLLKPTFPAAPAGGAKVTWALSVLLPDVPGGLDNERIALVQPDGTMDYYAKAAYPDRLPAIVQRSLVDAFEASGRIDAVAPEQAALHADYDLLVAVKDFAAHYSQPDGIPGVTVSLTAKLATSHGRTLVATFSTVQSSAASVNTAGAVVQALQAALEVAVTAIVNWALTMPAPATLVPVQAASPGKPAEQLLHDAARGSRRLPRKLPVE